jgi:transposase-like protein
MTAAHLCKRRQKPHAVWYLDEVYLKSVGGWFIYGAPSAPRGKVLDVHPTQAMIRKLLGKYASAPERLATDNSRSYAPTTCDLGIEQVHERGPAEEHSGREFAPV